MKVVIACLLVVVVWLSSVLVRVENERYALFIGLCKVDPIKPTQPCNDPAETRTSFAWHLWYALFP